MAIGEEQAYWLGFVYADGYVRNNTVRGSYYIQIALKRSDHGHLQKFKEWAGKGSIKHKINNNGSEYCFIRVFSKELVKWFVSYGCVQNKTFKLKYPDLPSDMDRHFIRGYTDGDGSLFTDKNGRKYLALTGMEDFLEGVREKLSHIPSNKPYYQSDKRTPKLGQLKWYCRKTSKKLNPILDHLYDGASVYLDRKFETYKGMTLSL